MKNQIFYRQITTLILSLLTTILIFLINLWLFGHFYSIANAEEISEDEITNITVSIPEHLSFAVNGVSIGSNCPNASATALAEISSTGDSINYGTFNGANRKIACQQTVVTTNAAHGYRISIQQNHPIQADPTINISNFQGSSASANTWSNPEVWSSPIDPHHSYFGFTTSDIINYPRFSLNRYGSFQSDNAPYEIVSSPGPVEDDTNYISYQLETDNLQTSGSYSNTVTYICTAFF